MSSLTIRVDNYAGLVALIRSSYLGRLVDVLEMGMEGRSSREKQGADG